jgi:hypothetical protein
MANSKNVWSIVLRLFITVATSIASVFGIDMLR